MPPPYHIPNEAAPYILFQRTEYLTLTTSLLFRGLGKLFPSFDYNRRVQLEAKLRSRAIGRSYLSGVQDEYERIKDHLPNRAARILDIGCGMAGIDLFLSDHYGQTDTDIYLLDKTSVDEQVYYLYERKGSFYNSLKIARDVLVGNGVPPERVHAIEATDDNQIRIENSADLVLSLISWGYHYPVSTYLDRVDELLAPNGVLILDVRKETDGRTMIEERFDDCVVIFEDEKCERLRARRL